MDRFVAKLNKPVMFVDRLVKVDIPVVRVDTIVAKVNKPVVRVDMPVARVQTCC